MAKVCLFATLFLMVLLAVASCASGSKTSNVAIDEEPVPGLGISSKDLNAMSRQMAESILQCYQIKERIAQKMDPAKIAFAEMTNETRDPDASPYQLLTEIRTNLIKHARGYLTFLEAEKIDQIAKENAVAFADQSAKSGTFYDKIKTVGGDKTVDLGHLLQVCPDLQKADYILTGRCFTKRQTSADKVSEYHVYTFWLTHVATRVIVWQDDYKVKKLADKGALYGRQ